MQVFLLVLTCVSFCFGVFFCLFLGHSGYYSYATTICYKGRGGGLHSLYRVCLDFFSYLRELQFDGEELIGTADFRAIEWRVK